jgi:hypothetical protein
LAMVSFRGLFKINGNCQLFYLPRKYTHYLPTYNTTDSNDDFAFAIMILNILRKKKEKVLAAIGDEVVERSNIEAKLTKLRIEYNDNELWVSEFKRAILSFL